MKVGYIRVSTIEQHLDRQEIALKEVGVEKVFTDKQSGKDTKRPGLEEMMNYVREGDIVIISEYARLGRSLRDLLKIVDELTEKGVKLISLKENFDTTTPQGELMLTVFAGLAEFERKMILERQREGIEAKKARGEYKGRVPIKVDDAQFEQEYNLWKSGVITAVTAMKHLDLKPNTFYRRVRAYEAKKGV